VARNGRRTATLERESEEVRSIKEGEESTQHPKHQEVALKFSSKKKFREALGILFDRNIAHSLVGEPTTVIVSSEHTTVFKPLKPAVSEVLSAGDLPPEEIAQLRREHLSFHDTDG
jgi:hypothetical protein